MYGIVNMLNLCYIKCDKYVVSYAESYIWRLYWFVYTNFGKKENKKCITTLIWLFGFVVVAVDRLFTVLFSLKYGYWTVTPMNIFMLMKYASVYCSFYIDEASLDTYSTFANVAKTRVVKIMFVGAREFNGDKMIRGM
jgi:hypothetical protein